MGGGFSGDESRAAKDRSVVRDEGKGKGTGPDFAEIGWLWAVKRAPLCHSASHSRATLNWLSLRLLSFPASLACGRTMLVLQIGSERPVGGV